MSKNKISKKSPCPCGSGKKYKKCCYNKDVVFQRDVDPDLVDLTPGFSDMEPVDLKLNKTFILENSPDEMSAHNVMFNIMDTGGLDVMLSEDSCSDIMEGKSSFKEIELSKTADSLIMLMKGNINPVTYPAILNKCLKCKDIVIPLLLNELTSPQVSMFTELSVFLLYKDGGDYSEKVMGILEQEKIGVYGASLLCLLLAFYDNHRTISVLSRYWNFYKTTYSKQHLSDGPIIALRELYLKRKSKLAGTVLA